MRLADPILPILSHVATHITKPNEQLKGASGQSTLKKVAEATNICVTLLYREIESRDLCIGNGRIHN